MLTKRVGAFHNLVLTAAQGLPAKFLIRPLSTPLLGVLIAGIFGAMAPAAEAGNTVVGALNGSFGVSPTGAATYSIPLTLPAGVHGIQPSLALVYNSQGGSGLAGIGWTLSGLSTITRCPLNPAEDGVLQGVTLTDGSTGDDYCLDGMKLRAAGSNTYRTEIEQFSLVTAEFSGGAGAIPKSGPQWFSISGKDGRTYTYGYSADSQILADGTVYTANWSPFQSSACGRVTTPIVRVWALTSISDRSGNSVTYHYANDPCTGDHWIDYITYTDQGSTPGPEKISFSYYTSDSLSVVPAEMGVGNLAGALVGHLHRLKGITLSYNGTTTYTYSLQYQLDAGSGNSELIAVQECYKGNCLQTPTKIDWQEGTAGWISPFTAAPLDGTYEQIMDVDGDGIDDVVLGEPTGTASNPGPGVWCVQFGSPQPLNGSGPYATLVAPFACSQTPGVNPYQSLPVRYHGNDKQSLLQPEGTPATWHILDFNWNGSSLSIKDTPLNIPATGWDTGNVYVADINGDGFDDIVFGSTCSNVPCIEVYFNGPNGINTTPQMLYSQAKYGTMSFLQTTNTYRTRTRVADFDGDGKADFLIYFADQQCITNDHGVVIAPCDPTAKLWDILHSTGTSFVLEGGVADADPTVEPLTLDFNGDGMTDLAYVCASGNSCTAGDWMLAASDGSTGFIESDTGVKAVNPNLAVIADFSGNGGSSILFPATSTGTSWSAYTIVYNASTGSYGLSAPHSISGAWASLEVGDLNGDGLADLVGISNLNAPYLTFALHQGVAPNLVSKITNGLGNYQQISYAPITDSSSTGVYTPPSPAPAYPVLSYLFPLYVVSAYTANSAANNEYSYSANPQYSWNNADPATYTDTYSYQGAKYDLSGRGFLGFATVAYKDSRLNQTFMTTYSQSFPYTGMATDQKQLSSAGGVQVETVVNKFGNDVTSGSAAAYTDANFPFVAKATKTVTGGGRYDALEGQLVSTTVTKTQYDSWGNPTLVTTDTNPGAAGAFEQNVIYTYTENAAAWCVNLPDSQTIARSTTTANTAPGTSNSSYANQARESTFAIDYTNCRVNSKTDVALNTDTAQSLTTTYSYGLDGTVSEIVLSDASGKTLRDTTYGYADPSGVSNGVSPTSITQVDAASGINLTTKQTWDYAQNMLASSTDPNGAQTQWVYDGFGHKTSETDPDRTYSNWTYNYCGPGTGGYGCPRIGAAYQVTESRFSSMGAPGPVLTEKYDSLGREVQRSAPLLGGRSYVETQFDSLGNTTAISMPWTGAGNEYFTQTQYDGRNRPVIVDQPTNQSNPTGTLVYTCYDTNVCNAGTPGSALLYAAATTIQPTSMTTSDAATSETTVKISDSQGNLIELDDAAGKTTYNVDAFGDLIGVTDATAHATTVDYDSRGHKIDLTDPSTGHWTYVSDALGQMLCQTDANGQVIRKTYDNAGRLINRLDVAQGGDCNSTAGNSQSWTYDTAPYGLGKIGSETDGANLVRGYTYNSMGQTIAVDTTISGVDYQIATTYDDFGRIATVQYPPSAPPSVSSSFSVSASASPANVTLGGTVTLTGTGSSDPNGLPVQYAWTQAAGPAPLAIADPDAAQTTVSASTPGNFSFNFSESDADGVTTASASIAVSPAVPVITVPANSNSGSYTVSWTSVAGADSYMLYESSNGGAFNMIATVTGGTTISYQVTSRPNGSYSYTLAACGNGACSAQSATASVVVLLPPAAPTGLTINPSSGFTTATSFGLAWTAAATATSYEIFAAENTSAYAQLGTSTGTSYQVTNAGGYTYTIYVEACNAGGCSAPSAAVTETILVPPFALTLETNPSWTGSFALYSMGGSYGATSYELFQSTNGGPYTLIQTIPPGPVGPDLSITGLANGNYSFYIETCGGGICSAPGPTASGTIMIPPSVSFSPSTSYSGTFNLSWSSVSTATYYQVSQSTSGVNGPWTTTNVSGTSYSARNLANGTYWFTVTPCNASVCSASSSTFSGTVNITSPSGLALSPNGTSSSGSYTLSWASSWNGSYNFEQYRIYQSFNGGNYVWVDTINNTTSQLFTDMAPGSYTYFVEACNQGAYCSPASNTITETVSLAWPNKLAFTPAGTSTNGSFTLSWNSTWNGPYPFEQYRIYQSVNGAAYTWAYTINNTASKAISGLSDGTYTYKIQACNENACSDYSATASETVSTGGGKGGGGGGGCPPPPYQCQLVAPDDLITMRGGTPPLNSQAPVQSVDPVTSDSSITERIAVAEVTSAAVAPKPAVPGTPAVRQGAAPFPAVSVAAERVAMSQAVHPQPAEAAFQALSDRRTEARQPSVLPLADSRAIAAWNAASRQRDPAGPQYAPPVFISYGEAKIQSADSTPYRFTVQYSYDDASSTLLAVQNADTGFAYWQANVDIGAPMDAWGHLLAYNSGNNISTLMGYDPATGTVNFISSGMASSSALQQLYYTWDGYGNLQQRCDANQALSESFTYDGVNRLSSATAYSGVTIGASGSPACSGGAAGQALGASYDSVGDILTKTDPVNGTLATYTYGNAAKPQQVTSVSDVTGSYLYDNDGNLLSGNGRTLTWTPDNLPAQITAPSGGSSFSYDPEGQRYLQSATDSSGNSTTTIYVGNAFEVVSDSSGISYRHNIFAGGQAVAVHTVLSSGHTATNYLFPDHLGGVDTVTDDQGNLVQKMSFDAFGARRDPCTWRYVPACDQGSGLKSITDRGFTFQEQLDNVGLVHMNGRVYDPQMGRFVSPDPGVSDPSNSQAFARYAYVYNRPLTLADPSGFIPDDPYFVYNTFHPLNPIYPSNYIMSGYIDGAKVGLALWGVFDGYSELVYGQQLVARVEALAYSARLMYLKGWGIQVGLTYLTSKAVMAIMNTLDNLGKDAPGYYAQMTNGQLEVLIQLAVIRQDPGVAAEIAAEMVKRGLLTPTQAEQLKAEAAPSKAANPSASGQTSVGSQAQGNLSNLFNKGNDSSSGGCQSGGGTACLGKIEVGIGNAEPGTFDIEMPPLDIEPLPTINPLPPIDFTPLQPVQPPTPPSGDGT